MIPVCQALGRYASIHERASIDLGLALRERPLTAEFVMRHYHVPLFVFCLCLLDVSVQAIRPELRTSGGGGVGTGTGAGGSGEAIAGQGSGTGGVGWVRHGIELEGLDTLWEIVLDAIGTSLFLARLLEVLWSVRPECKCVKVVLAVNVQPCKLLFVTWVSVCLSVGPS